MSLSCPADTSVLGDLLEAEHAAIYAYGVLGARLATGPRRVALTAYDAHRATRDELRARLLELKQDPPATAPAYEVTARTPAEAVATAVRVEEGLAVRWRDLVTVTADPSLRRFALQQLQDCAVRAALWRGNPVPFPGEA